MPRHYIVWLHLFNLSNLRAYAPYSTKKIKDIVEFYITWRRLRRRLRKRDSLKVEHLGVNDDSLLDDSTIRIANQTIYRIVMNEIKHK